MIKYKLCFLFFICLIKCDPNKKELKNSNLTSNDITPKFLLEVLDKNQLYVNFSEMQDETYRISESDKKCQDRDKY